LWLQVSTTHNGWLNPLFRSPSRLTCTLPLYSTRTSCQRSQVPGLGSLVPHPHVAGVPPLPVEADDEVYPSASRSANIGSLLGRRPFYSVGLPVTNGAACQNERLRASLALVLARNHIPSTRRERSEGACPGRKVERREGIAGRSQPLAPLYGHRQRGWR